MLWSGPVLIGRLGGRDGRDARDRAVASGRVRERAGQPLLRWRSRAGGFLRCRMWAWRRRDPAATSRTT